MSKKLADYPRIQLNGTGQVYVLKWALQTMIKLQEWKTPESNLDENGRANGVLGWTQLSGQVAASCCIEKDGKLVPADLKPEDVTAAYDGNPDLADMKYLRSAIDKCLTFLLASDDESSQSGNTPAPAAS